MTDLALLFKRLRHYALTDPARSRRYMAWVKEMPCIVCLDQRGRSALGTTSDPHHVFGSVHGLKSSDLLVVPLCREHHIEVEQMPERHRDLIIQGLVVCLHEFARVHAQETN